MITVIIPVYNVENYIDRCLESVIGQTYYDLEIILINDGSTDKSEEICRYWSNKDRRIRYISQDNIGLGPTRNKGVELATGEYIMFVDSDDWVEPTIAEDLLYKLEATGADIAVCDRFQVKEHTGEKEYIANEIDEVISVKEHRNCIHEITTSAWAKLYKKNIIVEHNVKEPAHYFEDAATPLLIALSNKVCHVKKPLYNYVYDRNGSIINSSNTNSHLELYMEYVISEFKNRDLFDAFKDALKILIEKRVSWSLWNARKNLENEYSKLINKYDSLYKNYFGEKYIANNLAQNSRYIYTWGSYNLMIVAKRIMSMNSTAYPLEHNCFSSLVAAMQTDDERKLNSIFIDNENDFRKYHILNEFKRDFLNKNRSEFSKIKMMLVDFLEERFEIAKVDDLYITLSDAVNSKDNLCQIGEYQVVSENERFRIWKNACDSFVEKIYSYNADMKIVLVKMKLTEFYGDEKNRIKFKNIEDINRINNRLEKMYEYFIQICPKAIVVDVETDKEYYTDEHYRHGCFPWHLNQYMYANIQRKIESIIELK